MGMPTSELSLEVRDGEEGRRAAARRDLVEALRLEPFHLNAYLRLIKTFLPQRMVRASLAPEQGEK
jgi:hypothetical protein